MATVRLRTAAIVAFSVVGLCLMAMDCGDDAQVEFGISYSWPQWAPQWTPDGFEVVAGLTASYLLVPADGSRMQEVAKGGDRFKNVLSASISPDGSRLVYATLRHRTKGWRNYELGSSALDGSDYNRLTETEAFESNPVWSPDGARIAFLSDRLAYEDLSDDHYGGEVTLFTMAPDGSDVRALAPNVVALGTPPVWSPDSRRPDWGAGAEVSATTGACS